MSGTSATDHIGLAALVDYWFDAQEASALEAHLLACDECAGQLAWIVGLADAIPGIARRGDAMVVMTSAMLDRLAAGGVRIREYRLRAGGSVNCTIAPADDLVVARLEAPLAGVDRLDFVFSPAGGPAHRLEDVPFDPSSGEVVIAQYTPRLRALGHSTEVAQLVAVGARGDAVIGEYTFNHSPFGETG